MNVYVLGGLRRKRAEIVGEVDEANRHLTKLRGDLEAIDKVLRLLDAGRDPSEIKGIRRYQRVNSLKHGEQTRTCLEILRDAPGPMSAREVAEGIAARKGTPLTLAFTRHVHGMLGRLTRAGTLRKTGKPRAFRWGLATKG